MIFLNRQETEKLLTIIQKCYKKNTSDSVNNRKEFDVEAFEVQVTFWQRSLADYNWTECITAFEYWINTEEYIPTLSEFKPIVARFRKPESFISPERAWEVVSEAVKRFGSYNSEEAFKTFSEPIKRAVRNVGGWQKICETKLGEPWDHLRRNFMLAFNDFDQEIQEQEILPISILRRLQQTPVEQLKAPE
jgi:hypothetical protein